MTLDISCRSLKEIGLEIPRWRTKCRPCKCMAVSQAFIFHFKWYSLLHFAVCQLLCWTFLLYFWGCGDRIGPGRVLSLSFFRSTCSFLQIFLKLTHSKAIFHSVRRPWTTWSQLVFFGVDLAVLLQFSWKSTYVLSPFWWMVISEERFCVIKISEWILCSSTSDRLNIWNYLIFDTVVL